MTAFLRLGAVATVLVMALAMTAANAVAQDDATRAAWAEEFAALDRAEAGSLSRLEQIESALDDIERWLEDEQNLVVGIPDRPEPVTLRSMARDQVVVSLLDPGDASGLEYDQIHDAARRLDLVVGEDVLDAIVDAAPLRLRRTAESDVSKSKRESDAQLEAWRRQLQDEVASIAWDLDNIRATRDAFRVNAPPEVLGAPDSTDATDPALPDDPEVGDDVIDVNALPDDPEVGDDVIDVNALPDDVFGSFSGLWSTTYGEMTLIESGSDVRGTYDYDVGRVVFSASGDTLDGYWIEEGSLEECSQPRDGSLHWGRLVITFDEARESFSGSWGYCEEKPDGTWTGERVTP